MSASLVGSEMCIRDSALSACRTATLTSAHTHTHNANANASAIAPHAIVYARPGRYSMTRKPSTDRAE
eukprot:7791597-Alexandrium_andersonii.AAC.1